MYSGQRYRISTSPLSSSPSVARVKTYRDVIEEYRRHPEAKSANASGRPCDRKTVGLLHRRPVTALSITHVGKESNRLEDVQAGLVHDPEKVYTEYTDPRRNPWQTLVLPVLQRMTRVELAARTGLSRSALTAIRSGRAIPRAKTRDKLTRAAAEYAREQLT
ncbi:MAG: helix-turn-helix domain-containing protein [Chloroflexota bacterium]|nr:helix-turn-helix domain-containing protein [Chloroflexota bacterium]